MDMFELLALIPDIAPERALSEARRAIDEVAGTPRARLRKPTLAAALRQAAKAGASVSGATIEAGKVTLTFGEPAPGTVANPWEQAMADLAKGTKQ
jgi:hypothetical protein